jgi:hypothetical protein
VSGNVVAIQTQRAKGRFWARRFPLLGVLLANVLVVLALCLSACSHSFLFDMGPATATSFSDAWSKIATEGHFDPATARIRDLRLEVTSSGSLQGLYLAAETGDGRWVDLGTSTPGSDSHIRFGVSIFHEGSSESGWNGPYIAPILAALDRVGLPTMIKIIPGPPAGLYMATAVYAADGGVYNGAAGPGEPVYFWQNGAFVRLEADDDRRQIGNDAAYFWVAGAGAPGPTAPPRTGSEISTTVYQSLPGSSGYLVIALGE